jgi:hypothetical protein
MALVLALIQSLGPLLLRGAEAGTLIEIAETGARLFALIQPLLTDPKTQEAVEQLGAAVQSVTGIRPAQPEDPVFAQQGRAKFGGR